MVELRVPQTREEESSGAGIAILMAKVAKKATKIAVTRVVNFIVAVVLPGKGSELEAANEKSGSDGSGFVTCRKA